MTTRGVTEDTRSLDNGSHKDIINKMDNQIQNKMEMFILPLLRPGMDLQG